MLPPVDPKILSNNPKFEVLYQDLCANRLNEDGSSKLEGKAQRERDTLTEDLRKARFVAAKRDLMKSGLDELSYRGDALPEELQEVVGVVAALLEGSISNSDRELLQGDVEKFKENIVTVAGALASRFKHNAEALASILDPDNPTTTKTLPAAVEKIQDTILADQTKITQTRLRLATEATKVQTLYAQIIETSIRVLEQTIHGSVARGTKAKADYLAQVADGMSKKLNLQHAQLMNQLYSPDFQEALRGRSEELESETQRVRRRVRDAEARLEEYRASGAAEGMADEYAAILRETEKVKAEIARLERSE